MLTITKVFHFEAAHNLPCHEGKCRNIHGHGYKLEVTVVGTVQPNGPASGMIMDFGELKKVVQSEILSKLDHTLLNDTVWDSFQPTTAENLCQYVAAKLIAKGLPVVHVRVWETGDSHADWRADK